MSLKSQFKVNVASQSEGIWLSYPANEDKTIPRFKVARMSVNNPRYAKAFERQQQALKANPNRSDEDDRIAGAELFIDGCLLEWENFQPEDDGKDVEYSRENAMKYLADLAWNDLLNSLVQGAMSRTNYLQSTVEARAKN